MFSNELMREGKRHIRGFLGVFAANELPVKKTHLKPFSFTVNTQPANLPGEHWIAVSCETRGIALLFDPLATFYPSSLIQHLNRMGFTKIYFNKIQYQDPSSQICGQLCLEFLKTLENLSLAEKVSLMM